MRLVADNTIDFARYLKGPAEAPHVKPASAWMDAVAERFRQGVGARGAKLPWAKTFDIFRMRNAEVTIWAGINGHGKTLITSQVILGLMAQDERLCVASMEMLPVSTMQRMTRQAMARQFPTTERITEFGRWTDNRLWLYDQQGTVRPENIIALARYSAEELHCTHLVVDSLMKCGIGVDDYNGQKSFVNELCAVAKDTSLHIHLVAHARKGQSEKGLLDKFDVKGASEIIDQVDNAILVWRNKPKEEALADGDRSKAGEPDCLLNICKQRHGEWEGKVKLWLDTVSMSYQEDPLAPPADYQALARVL